MRASWCLLVALLAVVLLGGIGCRNDIVGDPPLPDAGFEGEGEGEPCAVEIPAVSLRLQDNTDFIICTVDAVTLTDGDFTEKARVVDIGNGECRHQGGFRRAGSYVIDVDIDRFVPRQVTATAVVGDNACGDPVTSALSLTLQPDPG